MKYKKTINKRISMFQKKIYNNAFLRRKNGQMIMLMGITLAILVFVLSSLAAEISNLDTVITSERSKSILPEFDSIKETFGTALNYNLVDIIESNGELILSGNISTLEEAFNQTRDEYYLLELQYDVFFDAELQYPFFVQKHPFAADYLFDVYVKISVDDGTSSINEEVVYSITCRSDIV